MKNLIKPLAVTAGAFVAAASFVVLSPTAASADTGHKGACAKAGTNSKCFVWYTSGSTEVSSFTFYCNGDTAVLNDKVKDGRGIRFTIKVNGTIYRRGAEGEHRPWGNLKEGTLVQIAVFQTINGKDVNKVTANIRA